MQKFAKVKIIFNTPCDILGGLSRYEAGVLYENWGVLTPEGCGKLPGRHAASRKKVT